MLGVSLAVPTAAVAAPSVGRASPGARTSVGGHTAAVGTPLPWRPPTTLGPPSAGGPGTSVDADGTSLTIAQSNCRSSVGTAADLQSQFDQRGPVWGGGDGAEPIPIDQGRTVWLFGDTFVGGGSYGGPLQTIGFIHNSMAVQYNGSCFLYLFRSDGNHGWYSTIADLGPQDYYWPTSGSYDPASGVLSIVASVVHTDMPPGPWTWRVVGADVIRYRMNPVMERIGTERLFTYDDADPAQFGTDVLVDGGWAYFYGCTQTEPWQCDLARTDLSMHPSSLQYRGSSGWSSRMADAVPLDLDDMVGNQLHVAKVGDGYIASNQIPYMSSQTWGWWSPTVAGPFRPIGEVIDANDPPPGPMHSNWFSYGGRVINSSAGTIGEFSVNSLDAESSQVAGVYGPRFVDIRAHTLDRNPFGTLDAAATRPGAARVVGWSIDPDGAAPVGVRVAVDGRAVADLTADFPRPDVEQAVPGFGPNHGFDGEVALDPGVHELCVTGVNQGMGLSDRQLGCALASGSGPPSSFHPVDPVRILDSRIGVGGFATPWSSGQSRSLAVAGSTQVPADATAAIVNVTVTGPSASGYLSVGPSGGLVPNASNLNFVRGETATNLVTVQIGTRGSIDLTCVGASADVLADLVGYASGGTGDGFVPVAPARLLDSRVGTGGPTAPWRPGERRPLTVAGVGPVPANATAVVANVTVTRPTTAGWLQVSPTGEPPSTTSNLNFVPGETVPNLVIARIGRDGQVDLTNGGSGSVDVIADVVGYYVAATGDRFVPLAPTRILDSRFGIGGYSTPWAPGTRPLTVAGAGPVPADATAVVINVTVVNPTNDGWLRVSPTGQAAATTSNLNFAPGQTIPNLVVIKVGAHGQVDIFNVIGFVHVIADVVGYYRAATA